MELYGISVFYLMSSKEFLWGNCFLKYDYVQLNHIEEFLAGNRYLQV